jgi:CRISPR-associated Csx2 family protein
MARVLISFLGTNNYIACNYYSGTMNNKVNDVRFVQEAIIQLFCKDFSDNDRLLFFLTEEAEKKNWIDNGQVKHWLNPPELIIQDGLKTRLEALNLKPKIEKHRIENGFSNTQIWQIFDVVFKHLNDDDEVIFDITHAFRFLPMLGIVLMNYAKALHTNFTIKGIHYGAFEALGTASEVDKKSIIDRNAEILNLISLSILQDWSNAANDFVNNGSTKGIEKLILRKPLTLILENPSEAIFRKFQKLSVALNKMTLALSTVRGNEIIEAKIFKTVDKIADELKKEVFIAPLQPLLEQIREQVKRFKYVDKQKILNAFEAVDWCIENKLIQQGMTLLQEAIITYLIIFFDKTYKLDYLNYDDRELMKDILLNNKLYQEERNISKKIYGYNANILNTLRPCFKQFKVYRNDINHGGFSERAKSKEFFEKELIKIRKEVKDIFEKYTIRNNVST